MVTILYGQKSILDVNIIKSFLQPTHKVKKLKKPKEVLISMTKELRELFSIASSSEANSVIRLV